MNPPPGAFVSLVEPLRALQGLLDRFEGRGVIIGGIAAGFLGKPRFTVDLDALLLASTDEIPRILELAMEEGIEPRSQNAAEFARENLVLLLCHQNSGVNIDISLGILPLEKEIVERSVRHDAGALIVQLPTPEDLIILKAVAHRPKNLLDIQEIVDNNPILDVARIKRWVKDYAKTMEAPELWNDIKKILKPPK